jgi:prepilin-type N-terminal cleavage/methylation domain-containing protein
LENFVISPFLRRNDRQHAIGTVTKGRRAASGAVRYGPLSTGRAQGFTLFEVLLVLTILTLILGLAWPSLSRLFAHHRLQQAAELLSARMSAGRVHSVESGLIYQFRFEPGGRRFLLVPYDREQIDTADPNASRAIRVVGMLPDSCRFEGGQSFTDKGTTIPDEWLAGLANEADFVGTQWSQPVLFHPDGSATDFEVAVVGDKKEQVVLTLRGLTGSVVVSSNPRG